MAAAASRSSANTVLVIGAIRAEIGLFGTQAKSASLAEFDRAGPNGKKLKVEQRAVEAAEPVGDGSDVVPVQESDPLAGDPGPDVPAVEEVAAAGVGAPVGEFRSVLVEEGGDGTPVEPDDVRRGIRLENGRFIDCSDQLVAIEERTKLDRIEVIATVDSTQVRRERVVSAYYIGAQDAGAKPRLRLLYEALKLRREVAVVKYTTKSRQRLGIVAPNAKTGTLVLQELVYSDDWREPPAKALAIQSAKVEARQVEAMTQILAAMHDTVEAVDEQRDEAIVLREELATRARAGEIDVEVVEPIPAEEDAPDLMEALRASLEQVAAA